MSRPMIAIPGRFADQAHLIRREAIALSDRLMKSVLVAGGEPVMIYPDEPAELDARYGWIDGLLLPGGGDVDPLIYADARGKVYGVSRAQDDFDIALTRWALDNGIPTLAICRGFQVVNVALGGTLEQDMQVPHRDLVHDVNVDGAVAAITGPKVTASCWHHQRVERLADGLRVLSTDGDGTIEAADMPSAKGWFIGLQWHPEDTAAEDGDQAALFGKFVTAAAAFASARR